VEALAANVVISSRFGPILLPASAGFAAKDQPDAPVVNLSYWIFPAFKHLRACPARSIGMRSRRRARL
jgi:endoglucanase